ncbi:MAG: hypothetical protein ABR543_10895 [Gemmatimonadaceae bacterium]
MGQLRPNVEVVETRYMPGAFVTADGVLTLVLREGHGQSDPSNRIEKVELRQAVGSVEVIKRQLTILPWPAWVLGGLIITLALHLILWAFQYPAGRRSLTQFILHLRDGRHLTLRADRTLIQEIQEMTKHSHDRVGSRKVSSHPKDLSSK